MMEITKVNSPLSAEVGVNKRAQQPVPTNEQPAKSNAGAAQSTSEDWQLLVEAKPQLAEIADVDSDKVAALRQALTDGSFRIDLDEIASAMLRQHG
ncbi:flagellar biosynthesis anti-sigma factor FlgM [Shewanella waksmanii]|uniref:flagellar biosynthesis anti-sigma factor FlgM n=1 Tax=Shewanella waksmanii TaxID=213783 RepID=UPI00373504F5